MCLGTSVILELFDPVVDSNPHLILGAKVLQNLFMTSADGRISQKCRYGI